MHRPEFFQDRIRIADFRLVVMVLLCGGNAGCGQKSENRDRAE
jgi:hypothetical protein